MRQKRAQESEHKNGLQALLNLLNIEELLFNYYAKKKSKQNNPKEKGELQPWLQDSEQEQCAWSPCMNQNVVSKNQCQISD